MNDIRVSKTMFDCFILFFVPFGSHTFECVFLFLSFDVDISILMMIIMEHFSSFKHEIKSFGVRLMCTGVEVNEYTVLWINLFWEAVEMKITLKSDSDFVLLLFCFVLKESYFEDTISLYAYRFVQGVWGCASEQRNKVAGMMEFASKKLR